MNRPTLAAVAALEPTSPTDSTQDELDDARLAQLLWELKPLLTARIERQTPPPPQLTVIEGGR
jgi:hypothetical protein